MMLKPNPVEDLRRAVQVFVILAMGVLVLSCLWVGPSCADWLLEHLEEPPGPYRLDRAGHDQPWETRVNVITTMGPMLIIGLLGLWLLNRVDDVVNYWQAKRQTIELPHRQTNLRD